MALIPKSWYCEGRMMGITFQAILCSAGAKQIYLEQWAFYIMQIQCGDVSCQLTPKKLNYLNLQLNFLLTSFVWSYLAQFNVGQVSSGNTRFPADLEGACEYQGEGGNGFSSAGSWLGKGRLAACQCLAYLDAMRKFLTSCFSFVQQNL